MFIYNYDVNKEFSNKPDIVGPYEPILHGYTFANQITHFKIYDNEHNSLVITCQ